MTPDQMRVAVAGACGWKRVDAGWHHPTGVLSSAWPNCPDYPADLNAMHEAEKGLTEGERLDYGNQLIAVCDRDMNKPGKRWAATTFYILHATALQKCEAFLRVKGLWVEG